MKINHLNGKSTMRFKLLNESVTDRESKSKPLVRISVDGTFNIDLTTQDIADILIKKGFEPPVCFDIEPIKEVT